MKAYVYLFALLCTLSACRPQPFANWFVDDLSEVAAEPYGLKVMAIRITPQYTVLDVRFNNNGQKFYTNKGRYALVSGIWVSSNARLTTPDGTREFSFVKADGIPILPKIQHVDPIDQVSFSLYFQRLDKGIETIDWSDYARKDDPHHRYTVHNLHVDNPPDTTTGNRSKPLPMKSLSLIREAAGPMQAGNKLTLENIYFEPAKSELVPVSFVELDQVVGLMQHNSTMTIRIEGHTDTIGDHEKNRQLSQDRAAACRSYLMQKGVAADRIQAVGYGDTRPVERQRTTGSSVNRRVEFVILTP